MGLALFCPDPDAPIPRAVHLELACDGDHGLFPPAPAIFAQPSYVEQYAAAMAAGWRETSRAGRRLFLGPCCSGKRGCG